MIDFKNRLDQITERLISDELLHNKGLGKDIGFYIFDYPPEFELEMRAHLNFILRRLPKKKPGLRFAHINLFELVVGYLKQRNLLDRAIRIQLQKGDQALLKAVKGALGADKVAKALVAEAEPANKDLVLVSGVGAVYPLVRSHHLLNNLQPLMACASS